MTQHFSDIKAVRNIARSNWGRQFSSADEAEKNLVSKGVGDAALLEVVRRLNQAIDAWSKDKNKGKDGEDEENEDSENTPPDKAKVFPGIKVGDCLYSGDLEDGMGRYIVVAINNNGFARVAECESFSKWSRRTSWACEWLVPVEADALRAAAERDAAYHKARLEYAEKVIAAISAGDDLSEFYGGHDYDEDSE